MTVSIPVEVAEKRILLIRSKKVILDRDIAFLYGVSTGNLNKAVVRNKDRFPEDFMFTLTKEEHENLIFHFGTSSWGGNRKPPRAFTEQGVAMLSGVLRSKKAVQVNIAIMRAFVKIGLMMSANKDVLRKIEMLEKRMETGEKSIMAIYETLKKMIKEPESGKKNKQFGFK